MRNKGVYPSEQGAPRIISHYISMDTWLFSQRVWKGVDRWDGRSTRAKLKKKRRSKASSTIYYGISALSVLIALILWLLASTKGWVNPLFVPSPAAVWTAFLDIAREGYKGVSLAGHIGASMKRLFLALQLPV